MKRAVTPGQLDALANKVRRAVLAEPVADIHTHLYDPAFGGLLLWGIDDLLVYHYLVAETFRNVTLPYASFWKLSKTQQADWVWQTLFLDHSPVSEACRGVLTTMQTLGLDVRKRDLPKLRSWFKQWNPRDYTSHCLELAGVRSICMTNSPFDPLERPVWEAGFSRDPAFRAALRIDPLLLDWKQSRKELSSWGYDVSGALNQRTVDAVRRFLADWTRRMEPAYVMISLPPDFQYPGRGDAAWLLEKAVLPHCREFGLPFAVMPGVRRAVNPLLAMAGDGMERADLGFLKNLCAAFPDNRFAATVLSRENQHELCVLARKFRNLHIFGCWWFTNIPSIIEEMTRMRVELLGLSFTPQHSDARVLDQILYKWKHSREIIALVLEEKYKDLARTGWMPADAEIRRDIRALMGGTFEAFSKGAAS
ncbi:MAG: glucuronate isomerase [Verrucomicrobia bacterium]|nr:glucuronate isomerase [Verrucomicrobiota bacterium]